MSPDRERERHARRGLDHDPTLQATCAACRRRAPLPLDRRRCPCGGLLALDPPGVLPGPELRRVRPANLWRWSESLRLPPGAEPVSRGEGATLLERSDVDGAPVWLLREDLNPTGSAHDRGAATMVSALAALGLRRLVIDSPGNAALSVATYGAAAGLRVRTVVPRDLPEAKREALLATGAELHPEADDRHRLQAHALRDLANGKTAYASLAEDPFAHQGYRTTAYHIHEALGSRAPDLVACPLGDGALLYALHQGFNDLHRLGLAPHVPTLVGVRPVPPAIPELRPGDPAITQRAVEAARTTGGDLATVSLLHVETAQRRLWWEARPVEPAGATAMAWFARPQQRDRWSNKEVVLILTASGTRAGRPIEEPSVP